MFDDIDHHPAEVQQAILLLANLGISKGTSPTTFSPDQPVQRWEMAVFLARLLNLDEESPPEPDEPVGLLVVDVDGGSDDEHAAFRRALHESAFPWYTRFAGRTLTVRFGANYPASGGGTGITLPAGNGAAYVYDTTQHELGHVLDVWLNVPRWQITQTVCTHDPKHGWYRSASTGHHEAIGEWFAEAYRVAFHGGGNVSNIHPFDESWFRDLLEGL